MPVQTNLILIDEDGGVRLEPAQLPPLASDEVLIETSKTLISPGTERAMLLRLPGLSVAYPANPGYSHVGRIVALGSGVTTLKPGDRVASRSSHAAHVVAKAAHCHPLPAHLTDEEAAFCQLLAIALQAVRKTRLEVGEGCAVLGVGLVGQLALQVARMAGALPTIAVDRVDGRLRLAQRLGADYCLPADGATEGIRTLDNLMAGAPVVIEATGNPTALDSACRIAARGGRIALLGSTRGATESFDFYKQVHKRGITLIGAHISTTYRAAAAPGWWTQHDEQRTALRLLAAKRVDVAPLISHRVSSADAAAAYQLLAHWNLDAIGIIIDWTASA